MKTVFLKYKGENMKFTDVYKVEVMQGFLHIHHEGDSQSFNMRYVSYLGIE